MRTYKLDLLTPRELTKLALELHFQGEYFQAMLPRYIAKHGYVDGTYKLAVYGASVLTAIRSQRIVEIADNLPK